MSIERKIEQRIQSLPRGTLFIPLNFDDLGSSEAVRLSLFRLEKKGIITRVVQGIYVRPKINNLNAPVMPSVEEVAAVIAKRDKIRTIPTGDYALYVLGLSTQMPMNIVLLTDGSAREIKVGNHTLTFKKTTPKNLLAKGRISGLIIQILKQIGHGHISQEAEKKIVVVLLKEDPENLRLDIPLAPAWIQRIMKKALTDGKN